MACFEPKTNNIYHPETGELIGFRDPITGNFTGVGSWVLVSDDPCGNNNLLLDDNNIALKDDDGAFLFGD
jgi:hypothetical protein